MIKDINDINKESEEGKLLFEALIILSTVYTDKTPGQIIELLNEKQ